MKILVVFRGGRIERVEGPPGVPVEHRTLLLSSEFAITDSGWMGDAKKWLAEPESAKPMDLCGWSMFELGTTAGFKRGCATDKTWFREDSRGAAHGKWQAWLKGDQIVVRKYLPPDSERGATTGGPDYEFEMSFSTPQHFIRWAADLP